MVAIRPSQLWYLGCSTAPAHSCTEFAAEGARVAAGSNAALVLYNHVPARTKDTRPQEVPALDCKSPCVPATGAEELRATTLTKLLSLSVFGRRFSFLTPQVLFPTSWTLLGATKSLTIATGPGPRAYGSEEAVAACRAGSHQLCQPDAPCWAGGFLSCLTTTLQKAFGVQGQGGFSYVLGQEWPGLFQPLCFGGGCGCAFGHSSCVTFQATAPLCLLLSHC